MPIPNMPKGQIASILRCVAGVSVLWIVATCATSLGEVPSVHAFSLAEPVGVADGAIQGTTLAKALNVVAPIEDAPADLAEEDWVSELEKNIQDGRQAVLHGIEKERWPYSFVRTPFIHPEIVQDLTSWISDTGDQIVAINLLDSQASNRYFGDFGVREIDGQCPYVYVENRDESDERTEFGYRYIGMTESGVHILYTSDWGGGSGVFKGLMLITIEFDAGIDHYDLNGQTVIRDDRKRLLIKKLGEWMLGDRWYGELSVTGDTLQIGRDQGWFSESGPGPSEDKYPSQDRVLKIDVQPTNALGFGADEYPCTTASKIHP